MKLEDVVTTFLIVGMAAGWIAALTLAGLWWSLVYLVVVAVLFLFALRYALTHEERSKIHEA